MIAAVALAVGLAWIAGAVRLRRRRAEFAPTYAATGGIVYTAVQLGCAGFLILTGLVLAAMAVIFFH